MGGVLAYCDTDSALIIATREGGLVPCPEAPQALARRHSGSAGALSHPG